MFLKKIQSIKCDSFVKIPFKIIFIYLLRQNNIIVSPH